VIRLQRWRFACVKSQICSTGRRSNDRYDDSCSVEIEKLRIDRHEDLRSALIAQLLPARVFRACEIRNPAVPEILPTHI